ncbi:leptin-like [Parambassis ranga]|uniref:Leptin-like n=1 Tax=Parambassis ranga TaxID=210632 RepID=A0A6P7KCI7_9TELE|nr:leptin-like [Parambassis ranga]XP_028287298.1 leptin-like [Parambassis ranga]
MDYSLVFCFSLLHILSVGSAAPLQSEVIKMKSKVKWMAEQLVVRLNRDFQEPPGLTLSPPENDLNGSLSIVTVLDGYNSLISDSLNNVSQLKSEISSLTGYIKNWRQGHCSEQRPKPPLPEALQELQSRKEFIDTVGIEALTRVKQFLNLLLRKLDHLETC